MKHIIFIVNPIAGHHEKSGFEAMVSHCLDTAGYTFQIRWTEYAGHAAVLAREAVAQGVDVVAAVGGDGTVNEVARCLIGTDTVLAIIPWGSGNGLAHHLKLPMQPEEAIRKVINPGHVRQIDTAQVNGLPFISIAGVGFDAVVADYFARNSNRGFLTYAKVSVERFIHFKVEEYTITLDDEPALRCRPFLISFANSSQFGYDAEISPKARIDDGLLDVCVLRKPFLIEVPVMVALLFTRKIDASHFIDIYRAKTIRINRPSPAVVNIDGEPVMMEKELVITIHPLSLKVLSV